MWRHGDVVSQQTGDAARRRYRKVAIQLSGDVVKRRLNEAVMCRIDDVVTGKKPLWHVVKDWHNGKEAKR